jgi:hypothetical protein
MIYFYFFKGITHFLFYSYLKHCFEIKNIFPTIYNWLPSLLSVDIEIINTFVFTVFQGINYLRSHCKYWFSKAVICFLYFNEAYVLSCECALERKDIRFSKWDVFFIFDSRVLFEISDNIGEHLFLFVDSIVSLIADSKYQFIGLIILLIISR